MAPIAVGSQRIAGNRWRATNLDPQLWFAARGARSTFVFYVVGANDGALDPRLYFDFGDGFFEAQCASFQSARAALLRVDLRDCPDLTKVRLDPFDGAGEFELHFAADAEADALAKAAEADLAALEARHAPVLRADTRAVDYAPALGGRPYGLLRVPKTNHEHFQHACALAARELNGQFTSAPPEPLISLVAPIYNTPPAYLDDLLASFLRQPPGLAELILSDDGSTSAQTAKWLQAHAAEPGVRVKRNGVNRGIAAASNAGAAIARGRWIGLIDHDDALADHALAVVARAIAEHPRVRFFFTDEVIADQQLRAIDFFDKPAFDDVLLSGVNYVNHLSIYERDLFAAVGGFREGFDGSQDYDLLLRATARLASDEIRHIPYPAYIWRRDGASYSIKHISKATTNARRALAEAYAVDGALAEVAPAALPDLHRIRFAGAKPKVSIVVPNRDSFRLMSLLTKGLFERTAYPDFELIVVDNGSTDPETLTLYERLAEKPNFTLDLEAAPFNFSRQINRGFKAAKGDAVLLLNNDIEVIEPGWLAEMVECLAYPNVGVVGAKLLYPTGKLQHAGVAVDLGGLAGHWYIGRDANEPGPMGRLAVRAGLTAVTGACMLVTRACFEAVGGFDEETFPVAYNDIDFCLRARKLGFRSVYTPFARLIHHESASRGPDDRGRNRPRFLRDQAALMERHDTLEFLDPVLSPWRDRDHSEPLRITLDKLPSAR